jgi:hypothetical protein
MTDSRTFERFYSKVAINDGCWMWAGAKHRDGYGFFALGGSSQLAHRVSWQLENGPIPDGSHVLHRCDNPACVRPGHLFLGTNQDNVTDKMSKGRFRTLRGKEQGCSKLSDGAVREMRAKRASGATYAALGREYGVSDVAARNAVTGGTWSHVSREVSH